MTQIQKALLLAAAMIGIGIFGDFDIIPRGLAEWAPFSLLAMFPSVWMGKTKNCGATQ